MVVSPRGEKGWPDLVFGARAGDMELLIWQDVSAHGVPSGAF